ncbi:MAG: response regulator transcription factor [Chloroflexi bacterium]|nr:response regulator transcription factor [Chloroflexota bacterium]MBU1750551.1 response regulator transcription factor [Chloroflexota bacterium]MBU1878284.1 response regulator transcription factor [Chloroflexota bacterium]
MTESGLIRVMLVDDHHVVRRGLTFFLDAFDDLELVGEAADGAEAIRLCAEVQPHVVLMDLIMPEMDGVAATRAIRQAQPEVQVIALTSFDEPYLVQGALQAGAVGYLLKNASIDDLAEAIRAARAGRPTLAPEALQNLIKAATQPSASGYGLTERERQVLALIVEGLSNPEIARRLVVSRPTIKTHVSHILTKLGAANRAEAAALAREHHLVT